MSGCSGKVRHATWEAADEHLRNLLTKRDEHPSRAKTLNIYVCARCFGYHVGHNSKQVPPRRRGRHRRHHL